MSPPPRRVAPRKSGRRREGGRRLAPCAPCPSLGPRRFDRAAFDRAYDPGRPRERLLRGARLLPASTGSGTAGTIEYALPPPPPERRARARDRRRAGGAAARAACSATPAPWSTSIRPTTERGRAASGCGFVACDLLHDDLDLPATYDLVVLCEVIEHVPIPRAPRAREDRPRAATGRISSSLTTPNLYRLRNVLRLAARHGGFCHFDHPARGEPIGHFLEYSQAELRWQLARAGLEVLFVGPRPAHESRDRIRWPGSCRPLVAPLLGRARLWRDNLVACARRPPGSA